MTQLLEVQDLVKHYPVRGGLFSRASGAVHAVDGVSLALAPGETLGLVGESGCGKTTLARLVLRLEEPTSGQLRFDGEDLLALGGRALRARRRHFQIVFQDPMSSLNPRMTVGEILAEPLQVHGVARGAAADARVVELLDQVGIPALVAAALPARVLGRAAPAHRRGARDRARPEARGLRRGRLRARRLGAGAGAEPAARAARAARPRLPVHLARPVGGASRLGPRGGDVPRPDRRSRRRRTQLFGAPAHPYTQALLSAIPVPDPRRRPERIVLSGDVPSPAKPPPGCRFHTRCPAVMPRCSREAPPVYRVGEGHEVRCFLARSGGRGAAADEARPRGARPRVRGRRGAARAHLPRLAARPRGLQLRERHGAEDARPRPRHRRAGGAHRRRALRGPDLARPGDAAPRAGRGGVVGDLARRPHARVPPARRRALERRPPGDGARLRLQLAAPAHARARRGVRLSAVRRAARRGAAPLARAGRASPRRDARRVRCAGRRASGAHPARRVAPLPRRARSRGDAARRRRGDAHGRRRGDARGRGARVRAGARRVPQRAARRRGGARRARRSGRGALRRRRWRVRPGRAHVRGRAGRAGPVLPRAHVLLSDLSGAAARSSRRTPTTGSCPAASSATGPSCSRRGASATASACAAARRGGGASASRSRAWTRCRSRTRSRRSTSI